MTNRIGQNHYLFLSLASVASYHEPTLWSHSPAMALAHLRFAFMVPQLTAFPQRIIPLETFFRFLPEPLRVPRPSPRLWRRGWDGVELAVGVGKTAQREFQIGREIP